VELLEPTPLDKVDEVLLELVMLFDAQRQGLGADEHRQVEVLLSEEEKGGDPPELNEGVNVVSWLVWTNRAASDTVTTTTTAPRTATFPVALCEATFTRTATPQEIREP
jgi:hypothetical protein